MNLSLVIPCYNEENNIFDFFNQFNKVFAQNAIDGYEFIFVNDGSTDKTYSKLNELYSKYSSLYNIKVITFSRNFGKESAMYAGLSKATGDYVCIVDADLQQRPEVVVQMLTHMLADQQLDCVTAYQENRKENKFITAAKSAFYKIINKMSEIDFVNGASDFRIMKQSMVQAVLQMTEFHRFSKGIFSYVGFNTKYIPYTAELRQNDASKFNTRKLIKYAFDGIFAFSTMPLKLSMFVGFFSSVCSILYLIVVVLQKLIFGIDVPGYATIVVLVLLLGGVQLFCLGILGEYIAKMYVQVKNRPSYIVKEYLSSDKIDKNN